MHQLRLLLVPAEELHFDRAASRMFLSQPALSQQMRGPASGMAASAPSEPTRSQPLTVQATSPGLSPRLDTRPDLPTSQHSGCVQALCATVEDLGCRGRPTHLSGRGGPRGGGGARS
ncbi:LysR family transcriptional regulator [Streptomyces sp. NPDC029006]|uniref:helix-turn-helix domain-containing protein n=1 Tax=Streptomyces sp. NPDC029006 TaxID=3155467 RepID=UPI0033CD6F9D